MNAQYNLTVVPSNQDTTINKLLPQRQRKPYCNDYRTPTEYNILKRHPRSGFVCSQIHDDTVHQRLIIKHVRDNKLAKMNVISFFIPRPREGSRVQPVWSQLMSCSVLLMEPRCTQHIYLLHIIKSASAPYCCCTYL